MSGLENNNTSNPKIIRDENRKIIKTAEGILCEYVDSDGNAAFKFIPTKDSFCSDSSSAIDNEGLIRAMGIPFEHRMLTRMYFHTLRMLKGKLKRP